jgi:hypothetical protein
VVRRCHRRAVPCDLRGLRLEGFERAVDGDLLVVAAQAVAVRVRVGEETGLKDWVPNYPSTFRPLAHKAVKASQEHEKWSGAVIAEQYRVDTTEHLVSRPADTLIGTAQVTRDVTDKVLLLAALLPSVRSPTRPSRLARNTRSGPALSSPSSTL